MSSKFEELKKFAKYFDVIDAMVLHLRVPNWDENMEISKPDFLVTLKTKRLLKDKENQIDIPPRSTIAIFMSGEDLNIDENLMHNAFVWLTIQKSLEEVSDALRKEYDTNVEDLLDQTKEVMKEELDGINLEDIDKLWSIVKLSKAMLAGSEESDKKKRSKAAEGFESYTRFIDPNFAKSKLYILKRMGSAIRNYGSIDFVNSDTFERKNFKEYFKFNVKANKKGLFGSKIGYVFIPTIKINDKRFYSKYPWSFTYYKQLTTEELQDGSEFVKRSKKKKGLKKGLAIAGAIVSGFFAKGLIPIPGVKAAWADFALNLSLSYLSDRVQV